MAKHLFLVRHAEAASREARQDDKTRDLTPAGLKESLHLGAWLAEKNFSFDLIVSSSARRTEQTASLIAEGMKLGNQKILLEDILYDASVRQLLDHINNIEDGYNDVLLVGHSPSISYLAEYLTKADIGNMPTCGAAIIKFDLSSWKQVGENTGALERYVTPEN
jgi:phosphohistidine phosphatase